MKMKTAALATKCPSQCTIRQTNDFSNEPNKKLRNCEKIKPKKHSNAKHEVNWPMSNQRQTKSKIKGQTDSLTKNK